jgi:DNA helicase-2/ATP-dependent DNA helicase PcrA
MERDLLADLTPAQREAVTHLRGPLLILAGAGSGKTRVITRRVAYLLQQGVRPGNILAITFTNKAAGEMRQRVEAIVPGSRVWISTFHSLGARLLRQYAERLGLDRNYTIYDTSDRAKLVKIALEDAGLDNARFTPDTIAGAISKAKNQLLSPERYAAQAGDFYAQTVAQVYPIYEKRLREANAMDFDDLLYWPALVLKNDQELRAELDERFRYVLIDEYQDTNMAQYAIARALSVDHPNLCVVGDPDQSIYKFRGSDIRNILDFERDFPDARVLTLSTNYRSTKSILRAASQLIAHNKQRKPKDLVTDNPTGLPVTVLTFETGLDEAEGIAKRIREAVESKKRHYGDFAVFLRVNALTRGLETAFVKHRVPFQIVKGLAFFDRKENRDVLAYLRLLLNPRDDLSFLRAVNEPARGIGKVTLEHLRAYAEPRELGLLDAASQVSRIPAIKGKAARSLADFAKLIQELGQLKEAQPDEVIRQVLDKSGYRRMLMDSHDEEDEDRLANIEELITAAKQFAAEDNTRTIGDFLENITLASDVDGWDQRQDSVSRGLHGGAGAGAVAARAQPGQDGGDRGGAPPGLRRHDAGQGGTVSLSCPLARLSRQHAVCGAQHVSGGAVRRGGANRGPLSKQPANAGDRALAWRQHGGGARLDRRRGPIAAAAHRTEARQRSARLRGRHAGAPRDLRHRSDHGTKRLWSDAQGEDPLSNGRRAFLHCR